MSGTATDDCGWWRRRQPSCDPEVTNVRGLWKENLGVRRKVGDIFEIDLGDGYFAYAIALSKPLFGFYDFRTKDRQNVEQIEGRPIVFKIWVMDYAVTKGLWKKVGSVDVTDQTLDDAKFFKFDRFNGKISSYHKGQETPITFEEAAELEPAAVWDPSHVEDRLRDHFTGVPNRWMESLRPRR